MMPVAEERMGSVMMPVAEERMGSVMMERTEVGSGVSPGGMLIKPLEMDAEGNAEPP